MLENKTPRRPSCVLLLGSGPFIDGRLRWILEADGLIVLRDACEPWPGELALVVSSAHMDVSAFASQAVSVIGVETGQGDRDASGFAAWLHEAMSAEHILQIVHEVLFRNRGVRRFPRYQVAIKIAVHGEGRILQSVSENLSQGGAYIRTLNPFKGGTKVTLRILGEEELGELTGEVIYHIALEGDRIVRPGNPDKSIVAHPGMGIRFDEGQDPQAQAWIELARKVLASQPHGLPEPQPDPSRVKPRKPRAKKKPEA